MSRIDLRDVTFNIPIKIDCVERASNFNLVIDYLTHHFDTNIIVYEAFKDKPQVGKSDKYKIVRESIGCRPFHRTKYLNKMAMMSTTDLIVNYDSDVLCLPQSCVNARHGIKDCGHSACFPYDGNFLNVPREFFVDEITKKNFDINFLIDYHFRFQCFHPRSTGGAMFWSRKDFIAGGMENENFVSWGYEDRERIHRFKTLGYRITRTSGALYHLEHPRGKDSSEKNPFYKKNGDLYRDVISLDANGLREYISRQPWILEVSKQSKA